MKREMRIGDVVIDDDSETFVIAEIGHNHQGDLQKCKDLFEAAARAGASAVKLQKRNNRVLFTREMYDSPYNSDARKRMINLRNRIAAHEMHALRFYMDRGAFLAAARRAERIVATYPGTPVVPEALALMERAYRTLGLEEQAQATETLLRGNGLPTAADLGEAQVEPTWWVKVGTRIGSWFGLSGGSTDSET